VQGLAPTEGVFENPPAGTVTAAQVAALRAGGEPSSLAAVVRVAMVVGAALVLLALFIIARRRRRRAIGAMRCAAAAERLSPLRHVERSFVRQSPCPSLLGTDARKS
jgi:hypothetical protein